MTADRLVRLGLAAYRVGRLVAQDEISRPYRARVNRWAGTNEDGSDNECPETLREKAAYLVGCPYCVSVWAAAGLVLVDRRAPVVADVLAVAGVAALVVSIDGSLD